MINRRRVGIATGCLMLFWTAVSAQQTPATQPPVVSGQPVPVPPLAAPPLLVQPAPFQPLPGQQQVPPSAINVATVPATIPLVTPVPVKPAPPPELGGELRGKLKADEQHFGEKSAAAKREFDLRAAEEKKGFEATLADKGFWERRRLTRAFRAEQAKRYKDFNDVQEANRRTHGWLYP